MIKNLHSELKVFKKLHSLMSELRMILYFVFILIFFSTTQMEAKLKVSKANSKNLKHLVENILMSGALKISNIRFTGNENQIGTFDGSASNLNIGKGIIISTGDIDDAVGPNIKNKDASTNFHNAGDIDLKKLMDSTAKIKDAAVLEFDFIPEFSSAKLNYVFASEEYPENADKFSDIFAFFIDGHNMPIKKNIAVIPGTDIFVSTRTLNHKKKNYSEFYVDNLPTNDKIKGKTIRYDGFTTVLTAVINDLIPNKKYSIKIAIADYADGLFDSAVFLQANSFKSEPYITLDKYCFGDKIKFKVGNIEDTFVYEWDFGDGHSSKEHEPIHTYKKEGRYKVKLMLKKGNQEINIDKHVRIQKISIDYDYQMLGEKKIKFRPIKQLNLGQIRSYNWDFGNGMTSNKEFPEISYSQDGVYNVSLEVTTDLDCSDKISKQIPLVDGEMSVRIGYGEAMIGQITDVPIYINDLDKVNTDLLTAYTASLSINSTIMYPRNNFQFKVDSISRGRTYITFTGDKKSGSLEIVKIPFRAYWGDAEEDEVILEHFEWIGIDYRIKRFNNKFKVLDICDNGRKRLFLAGRIPKILSIVPNPISTAATLTLFFPNKDNYSLEVYDVLGNKVYSHRAHQLVSGEIAIDLPVHQLSSGTYMCILSTQSSTISKMIKVVK